MGVDFSQQGLSRMTCRLCTARHMPCSNFDLKSTDHVLRRGGAPGKLCATRRKIGAGVGCAPRSGACRAATKRVDRPAGVCGAWSLRRCAWACSAHAARGDGQRMRFIERERGYRGVGSAGFQGEWWQEKRPAPRGAGLFFVHDVCAAADCQKATNGPVCVPILAPSSTVYTLRPKKNGRPHTK